MYQTVLCIQLVMISVELLLRRMVTGEKGPATELEPTLFRGASATRCLSQPQILPPPSPFVLFLLSPSLWAVIPQTSLQNYTCSPTSCTYNIQDLQLLTYTSMTFLPCTHVALPIPVVLISIASRHQYYLIRHSFDEGSPHYNQVKAWVSACTESWKIRFLYRPTSHQFCSLRCWLPSEKGMIFAFVGPMIVILLVRYCTIESNLQIWLQTLLRSQCVLLYFVPR